MPSMPTQRKRSEADYAEEEEEVFTAKGLSSISLGQSVYRHGSQQYFSWTHTKTQNPGFFFIIFFFSVSEMLVKYFKAYFIGTAQATSTIDYDTQRTHLIIARCASPTESFTASVTIEVDILPNQQPVISNYPSATSQLFEGNIINPLGTTIYTVTANDPEGDALRYIMTQSPENNWLTIGAYDGVIRTAVDTRVITSDYIICTVTVSDGHDNIVNNFIVAARFQNLNTRPYISNLPSNITVTEVQTSGFVLETLTYGDDTPPTNHTALEPDCSVNPVSECYKIIYESETRQLKLKTITTGQLDFKTTSKYLITCVLSDGYLSSEGDVLTMYGYKCTDQSTEESCSDDDAFFAALIALTSLTLLVVLWHVYCRGKKAAQQPPLTHVYPSHKGSKIPTMRGYI
ncbi:uncharacterized protein [Littorina saxatilis]|uniref:uncharacterized protein n=1 Tax=Littorina saxatilis TaxID=31220 RepID=UPI0038B54074